MQTPCSKAERTCDTPVVPCILTGQAETVRSVAQSQVPPAGRAITKLLSLLDLDADQQTLFVGPVGAEEAVANTASTTYDKVMLHCAGIILGARVVVATAGLIWEQKGQTHSPLRAHMESLDVLTRRSPTRHGPQVCLCPSSSTAFLSKILLGDPWQSPGGVADNLREHRTLRSQLIGCSTLISHLHEGVAFLEKHKFQSTCTQGQGRF